MVRRRTTSLLLAALPCLFGAPALAAEPQTQSAAAPALEDLQSPEQRDLRHEAYSLPAGMWAVNVGALGISGGDVFAQLGLSRGLGAGFQVEANLAHASVGLLNVGARWHFIDTRHFDLGAGLGFWYGHGEWLWIVRGAAKELVSKLDVISVPVALTASVPVSRSFAFSLGLEYRYVQAFGTISRESAYRDAYIGARQFAVSPSARWFATDTTSLELSAHLPPYTSVPVEVTGGEQDRGQEFEDVPFSETWSVELGLRSRFQPGIFGNLRLHYGEVVRTLYSAVVYPSFELEFRF